MSENQAAGGAGDSRREFVGKAFVWLGVGGLATSLASTAYANFRFFFPKVLYEPPAQFKAGFPADYQANAVSDRWAKEHQVWIVREDSTLYALLTVCTHLGCLTGYFPGEELFKCPVPRKQFFPARRSGGGTGAGPALPPGLVAGRGWADRGRQERAGEPAGPARPNTLCHESLSRGLPQTQPMDHAVAGLAVGLPSRSAHHSAQPLPGRLQQFLFAPAPRLPAQAGLAIQRLPGVWGASRCCCS